ncbi:MAG: 2-iminoacetate synthase ThiH [Endomicrobium sp.]|jgi:2-iminoacetate synthase|nr:2-iminoacetate synthase ThiH [Endomicrobium sp.]
MSFYNEIQKYKNFDFKTFTDKILDNEVLNIINNKNLSDLSEQDFLVLLSPKALNHIERIAKKSNKITVNNFGKSILLYAPLYVSNFCINNCLYCGFSTNNNIKRKTLNFKEIEKNCKIINGYGICHILLVCAESRIKTSLEYLKKSIEILKKYFNAVDLEIYPLEENEYREFFNAGVSGLTVYQESYDENLYKSLHTKGTKTDYKYRLETCERAGKANYRNLNVGALLGLKDFISEVFFAGIHAQYLKKKFPHAEIGISFPRLRPAEGGFQPKTTITDIQLVQAICAVRIFINRINITISTRESSKLRNNIIPLGITKMSAGSSTEVGGYIKRIKQDEVLSKGQFIINDIASVASVKDMIYKAGYQPVMKDMF